MLCKANVIPLGWSISKIVTGGKNQACQIQLISLGLFKGPNKKALTVKLGKKNIIVYDYIVDTI